MLEGVKTYFDNSQILDRAKTLVQNSKEDLLKTLSNVDKKTALTVGAAVIATFALIGGAAFIYRSRQATKAAAAKEARVAKIIETPKASIQAKVAQAHLIQRLFTDLEIDISELKNTNESARKTGKKITFYKGTFEIAFSNKGKAFVSVNDQNQVVMYTTLKSAPTQIVLIDENQTKNAENIKTFNDYVAKTK